MSLSIDQEEEISESSSTEATLNSDEDDNYGGYDDRDQLRRADSKSPEDENQMMVMKLQKNMTNHLRNIKTGAVAKVAKTKQENTQTHRSNVQKQRKVEQSSQKILEEILVGWTTAGNIGLHQELQKALEGQQKLCATVIQDKKSIINDLKQELYQRNVAFVRNLRKNAEELNLVIGMMEEHMKIMTEVYREEVDQTERLHRQEVDMLLNKDINEWEKLIKSLCENELQRLKERRAKVKEFEERCHIRILRSIISNAKEKATSQHLRTEIPDGALLPSSSLHAKLMQQSSQTSAFLNRMMSSLKKDIKRLQDLYRKEEIDLMKRSKSFYGDYAQKIHKCNQTQMKIKRSTLNGTKTIEEMQLMIDEDLRKLAGRALTIDQMICQHLGVPWTQLHITWLDLNSPMQLEEVITALGQLNMDSDRSSQPGRPETEPSKEKGRSEEASTSYPLESEKSGPQETQSETEEKKLSEEPTTPGAPEREGSGVRERPETDPGEEKKLPEEATTSYDQSSVQQRSETDTTGEGKLPEEATTSYSLESERSSVQEGPESDRGKQKKPPEEATTSYALASEGSSIQERSESDAAEQKKLPEQATTPYTPDSEVSGVQRMSETDPSGEKRLSEEEIAFYPQDSDVVCVQVGTQTDPTEEEKLPEEASTPHPLESDVSSVQERPPTDPAEEKRLPEEASATPADQMRSDPEALPYSSGSEMVVDDLPSASASSIPRKHTLPPLKRLLLEQRKPSPAHIRAAQALALEARWERISNIIPDEKIKVWEAAESKFMEYHTVLKEIGQLIPETEQLEQRNQELRQRLLQRRVSTLKPYDPWAC